MKRITVLILLCVFAKVVSAQPDLTITANLQIVFPSTVAAGGSVTAICSETNSGNAAAGANHVTLWLSSDAVLNTSNDIFLGVIQMPPVPAGFLTALIGSTVQIPNTCSGDYYVFFWADGNQAVIESNENNNLATSQITINGFNLPAPTAGAATSIATTSFQANWAAVSGATTYRLDVSANPAFSSYVAGYQDLNVSNVTSFIVSGLSCNTNYYYRVRARNNCVTSANSGTIVLTTASCCVPPIITSNPFNQSVVAPNGTSFSITANGSNNIYQWQVSTDGGGTWANITAAGTGPTYAGWTTTTLSLSGTVIGNNGYQYRCVVSSTCTPSTFTSNAATLIVTAPCVAPAVTTHPTNQSVIVPSGTSFSITASGSNNIYQWQVSTNGGVLWNDITAAGANPTYAGWTTTTLVVSLTVIGNNGYQYRCVVSSTCTPLTSTSNAAILTVTGPCVAPTITTHPANQTIAAPGGTNFTVVASGSSNVYQWQVSTNGGGNWTNITAPGVAPTYSGWTTTTLSVSGTVIGNNGYQYRCVVSSTCTTVTATSNAAILTVTTGCVAPIVTTNPANQSVTPPAGANFTVAASGSNNVYQWQVSTDGGTTWTDITAAGANPTYSGWTTTTLTLSGTVITNNGYQYRCIVSSTCTTVIATSNPATLAVTTACIAPAITTHPSNQSVIVPNGTSFSVTASGSGNIYRWQVSTDGGGTWINIIAAGVGPTYSGWLTPTLSLTGTLISNNGYQYRCIVFSTCTTAVATSNAAILTVAAACIAPIIISHPSNQSVVAPNGTSFSVVPSGSGNVYQWQVSTDGGSTWTNITAAGTGPTYSDWTTPTLTLSGTVIANNGYQYRAVVSSTCTTATATSNAAILTVNAACVAPNVTTHPANQSVTAPAGTSFTVAASGSSNIYQWQVSTDGGNTWTNITAAGTGPTYSGWTTATLTLSGTVIANNGYRYRCVVSSTCTTATATSNAAILTVTAACVAPTVTTHPGNQSVTAPAGTSFTVAASGSSNVYQWQVSTDGGNTWTNIIAAGTGPTYSGWTTTTLTLSGTVITNNGYRYRAVVSSTCTTATATSNAAILTVTATCVAPAVTTHPANQSVVAPGGTSFSITASGSSNIYQWQVSTDGGNAWTNITAAGSGPTYAAWTTTTLTLSGTVIGNNGYRYRCVVSSTCTTATATSNAAILTVTTGCVAPVITTQPSNQSVVAPGGASFTVVVSGSNNNYQWQVSTDGGNTWANITAAGSNPTYSGWTTATLSLSSTVIGNNGYQYRCVVSSTCTTATATSNAAVLSVNSTCVAPTITSHPANQAITAPGGASFGVAASGSNNNYQWQVSTNGGITWTNITAAGSSPTYSGWTTQFLSLSGTVVGNDGYQYRCVVSSTCTSATATSNPATLTFTSTCNAPAITTQPSNQSVVAPGGTSFSVVASGSSNVYQWQVSTNGGGTWTNITAAGSSPTYLGWTTTTLTLSGTIAGNSGYQYRCVVSSTCSSATATSNAATLTITTTGCIAPAITTQPSNQSVVAPPAGSSFTIAAAGSANVYQWQVSTNGGTTWTNITAAGSSPTYSGWTTATLTLSGTIASNSGYQYRCLVSSTCTTATATSNAATFSFGAACTGGAPTVQAGFSFAILGTTEIALNILPGNGTRRLVKINTINSFVNPVNGTDPAANPFYSGSGEQVVFNGSGASAIITNLNPNTNYCIRIYEANCSGTSSVYDIIGTNTLCQNTRVVTGLPAALDDFKIYPNPNDGIFTVKMKLNTLSEVQFRLINTTGQTVYESGTDNLTGTQTKLITTKVPPGYYVLETRIGDATFGRPVIIIRQ